MQDETSIGHRARSEAGDNTQAHDAPH